MPTKQRISDFRKDEIWENPLLAKESKGSEDKKERKEKRKEKHLWNLQRSK